MAIKLSISNAKRLGFSIKGYVFTKDKKTPQPVLKKAKRFKKKKKNIKREYIKLKDEGRIVRLVFED